MTTKVILREDVWNYHYTKEWTDSATIPLRNPSPELSPLQHFPDEIVDTLEGYGIYEFFRERHTLPSLIGLSVIDSVTFENEKDALVFILTHGDHVKHTN